MCDVHAFFFSFSIEHKIILRSSNDSRHSHILALVSLVAERENETEVVVAINPHELLLLVKLLPESEIWIYDRGKVFESTNSGVFYEILRGASKVSSNCSVSIYTTRKKAEKWENLPGSLMLPEHRYDCSLFTFVVSTTWQTENPHHRRRVYALRFSLRPIATQNSPSQHK